MSAAEEKFFRLGISQETTESDVTTTTKDIDTTTSKRLVGKCYYDRHHRRRIQAMETNRFSRNYRSTFTTFTVLIIFLGVFGTTWANPDAKRLYDDLLSNYNRLIRPVANNSEIMTIRLGLKLTQLIDLNLKNQIMTTNVWLLQIWYDYKLTWEPEEYGGVDHLYVPSELLWIPDIVLYDNADGHYVVTTMTKAIIYHNGTVVWNPPAIFKSYCQIDVLYFPFDQQKCSMKFGSWTYGHMVDLQHVHGGVEGEMVPGEAERQKIVDIGIDLVEYYPSVEWDVMAVPAVRHVIKYACCEEVFPDIVFYISLRRKTLFYTVNLIIPCVGISYLAVLVFYLPVDSGEKVTLCISIMLSLVMFFMLITEIMPSTSLAVPLLGKYLLFTMFLVGLSVVVTIIEVNIHYREPSTHRMAGWVKRIFTHLLPRILMMKRPELERTVELCPPPPPPPSPPPPPPPPPVIRTRGQNGLEMSRGVGDSHQENQLGLSSYGVRLTMDSDSDMNVYQSSKRYPREIERAIMNLKFIAQHMANHDEFNSLSQDWKYVSMVIDRLFLWIFGIATIVGTFGIICQAPTLYDDRHAIDVKISQVQHNVPPDI